MAKIFDTISHSNAKDLDELVIQNIGNIRNIASHFKPKIEWFWDRHYCPHCREFMTMVQTFSMVYLSEQRAVIYYNLCPKCSRKLQRYQQSDHREGQFSEITEKSLIPAFMEWLSSQAPK